MKTVESIAFQGDVCFVRVDEVPTSATEQPQTKQVIVTHSETGHHHVINDAANVWLYSTKDQMVSYLKVQGHADVVHLRDFDTHEPVRLPEGIWEIHRQEEHSPDGWRVVAD